MKAMRLWMTSYARPLPLGGGAALSLAFHLTLITAWVAATRAPASMSDRSIANRVFYIPPVQRVMGGTATREVVHFIDLSKIPLGDATAHRMGDETPTGSMSLRAAAAPLPPPPHHAALLPASPPGDGSDSVFTEIEVDSAATVSSNSAAPVFPLSMLQSHTTGFVSARYIVDTTGLADTTSFHVIQATTPQFANAVRAALPYMRFHPAKMGTRHVRQLVQQNFVFRIATDTTAAPPMR